MLLSKAKMEWGNPCGHSPLRVNVIYHLSQRGHGQDPNDDRKVGEEAAHPGGEVAGEPSDKAKNYI